MLGCVCLPQISRSTRPRPHLGAFDGLQNRAADISSLLLIPISPCQGEGRRNQNTFLFPRYHPAINTVQT